MATNDYCFAISRPIFPQQSLPHHAPYQVLLEILYRLRHNYVQQYQSAMDQAVYLFFLPERRLRETDAGLRKPQLHREMDP